MFAPPAHLLVRLSFLWLRYTSHQAAWFYAYIDQAAPRARRVMGAAFSGACRGLALLVLLRSCTNAVWACLYLWRREYDLRPQTTLPAFNARFGAQRRIPHTNTKSAASGKVLLFDSQYAACMVSQPSLACCPRTSVFCGLPSNVTLAGGPGVPVSAPFAQ